MGTPGVTYSYDYEYFNGHHHHQAGHQEYDAIGQREKHPASEQPHSGHQELALHHSSDYLKFSWETSILVIADSSMDTCSFPGPSSNSFAQSLTQIISCNDANL